MHSQGARPTTLRRGPLPGFLLHSMLLAASLLLALAPRSATAQALDLPSLVRQSDAILVAQVSDPKQVVVDYPLTMGPGRPLQKYQRLVRHFLRQTVLVGSVPSHLRVDETQWRTQLAAIRACPQRNCPAPARPTFASSLTREPKSGDTVLLFVKEVEQGYELTAEISIDSFALLPQVRALLPQAPALPKRPRSKP